MWLVCFDGSVYVFWFGVGIDGFGESVCVSGIGIGVNWFCQVNMFTESGVFCQYFAFPSRWVCVWHYLDMDYLDGDLLWFHLVFWTLQ